MNGLSPIPKIQSIVAAEFGMTRADMETSLMTPRFMKPRQVAMWICRQMTESSFGYIGSKFRRDHSTVVYSVKKVERMRGEDEMFRIKVDGLMAKCEEVI